MKIFRIETGIESELIAANTAIEALKIYTETTEIGLDQFSEGDDIREVPKDEWDQKLITFPDEPKDSDKVRTYKEVIENLNEPTIIASSAY